MTKTKNYATAAALVVLLTAGLAMAMRPGITMPLNATSTISTVKYSTETNISATATTTSTLPSSPQSIGGQLDSHGCLVAAGFSWNATRSKCIRPWNGEIQLATGTVRVNVSDPNWREKLAVTVPISIDVKCIDTDEGKDYFTAGTVYMQGDNPKKDACLRHFMLREWFCDSKDKDESTFVVCKKGCKNGACLPEHPVQTNASTR